MKSAWKALVRYGGSVRSNGLRGTLENAAALVDDLRFDHVHGTRTAGSTPLGALEAVGANKHLGVEYTPTRVRAFRKLIAHLGLPEGRVFVDFGCGKGRVLCAAAAYPFRRIVGVEFAPELAAICRANLAACRRRFAPKADIVVIEGDAAEYRFAGDENVIFLFNPFHPTVMVAVLANLHRSLRTHHRVVLLIISNPDTLAPVLARDAVLRKTDEYAYGSSRFFIYSNA